MKSIEQAIMKSKEQCHTMLMKNKLGIISDEEYGKFILKEIPLDLDIHYSMDDVVKPEDRIAPIIYTNSVDYNLYSFKRLAFIFGTILVGLVVFMYFYC